MQQLETPFGYILVLDRGEELLRSLIEFARHNDIDAATLHGLGAVDRVELGFYRLAAQDYERRTFAEPLEVCSLTGNISLLDGEPLPHVHGVFGRADFTTVGGHVFEAVCSITLEISVHVLPEPIHRGAVDFCNLKLLKLES